MRKTAAVLVAGLAIGFGLGFSVRGPVSAGGSDTMEGRTVRSASRTPFLIEGRPFQGPEDAPVEFVEFTDYECPFCRRFHDTTYPEIRRRYDGRVKWVVRNFPLTQIHPNAALAAEAAECALEQGRFWDYHDLLFERHDQLSRSDLKGHARELDLDGEQFDRCLDSGEKRLAVQNDLRDGFRFGVTGTPTFFINGQVVVGAQTPEVVSAFIDVALQEAADMQRGLVSRE
ncbi:MAG: DsbA family protein [Gemmatimonadota bacterium]|nr:DsbA family protein [Gemmatimonadota bacterium]MDH3427327.1 DsbA family protein [Gemmatimonadota bacterium]